MCGTLKNHFCNSNRVGRNKLYIEQLGGKKTMENPSMISNALETIEKRFGGFKRISNESIKIYNFLSEV